MIDLHTHYLPKIDDGAKTVGESIDMLEDSFRQGVRICVATPHCVVHCREDIQTFAEKRQKSLELLKKEITEIHNVPQLLLGAEVYLDNDLSEYDNISSLCMGDSNYMLVELSDFHYKNSSDWLYNLKLNKINPIIAHIDRYANRHKFIRDFSGLNVVYQINASQFFSISGRRFVKKLLTHTDRVVVSSDMHNMKYRPCTMKKAYKKAKKMLGDIADKIFNIE